MAATELPDDVDDADAEDAEAETEPDRRPPPLPAPPGDHGGVVANAAASSGSFQQELEAVEAGLLSDESSEAREDELEDLQLQAARKLRQLLSTNRELLIHEVLERNWVPLLLGWLELHQRPAVQVEALWALTNIAAGTVEHTHVLIKHGAAPTLVTLLSSSNEEVRARTRGWRRGSRRWHAPPRGFARGCGGARGGVEVGGRKNARECGSRASKGLYARGGARASRAPRARAPIFQSRARNAGARERAAATRGSHWSASSF